MDESVQGEAGAFARRTPDTLAVGEEESTRRRLALTDRVSRILLAGVALIVLGSAAILAAGHISDRYNVNHVAGAWMGLARALAHGDLYLPLYDHGYFGGTRFMPLPILLHGGIARLSGEYLVSGKVATALVALLLFGLLLLLLRRLRCSWALSLGLIAAVIATPTGLLAVTGIRGDTLSVLFQVAAVALVASSTRPRTLVAAGSLSALALVSKLSAVWAPLAILLWLLPRDRRRAGLFLGTWLVSVALLVAVLEVVSSGRMLDNVGALAFAGGGSSPTAGLSSLLDDRANLGAHAIWLLLPLALYAVILSGARRRLTLWQIALVVELPILVVVFSDSGADYNHLIDLAVLTTLVVGEFIALSSATLASARSTTTASLNILVALVLLLGIGQSYVGTMKREVHGAAEILAGRNPTTYPLHPLDRYVRPGDSLLSEDASVPILMGQRPVVLDSFMLPRLQSSHPQWIRELIARIHAHDFDEIVLLQPITNLAWFAHSDWGSNISGSIRDSYKLEAHVQSSQSGSADYWVYVPAARS